MAARANWRGTAMKWSSIAAWWVCDQFWYGRKCAWEALVAEWEGGDVSVVSPPGAFLPLAGMKAINEYAIMRGQELQRELIGCAELPTLATMSCSRLCTY